MGRIPKVDELAAQLELPRPLAIEVARQAIEIAGDAATGEAQRLASQVASRASAAVINATGVLLHTNLGRAPWPQAAIAAAAVTAGDYSNLEFDTAAGQRSGRGAYAARLAAAVTGAEAGLIVNNNAAALALALAALAGGGTVAVSRGELIEIGGSFRLPELMIAAGCRLLEVGTTNRTRIGDFEAVASSSKLLLKVHPSNYRIEGFTESVGYPQMGILAKEHGIRFVADVGSGLLDARVPWFDGPPPAWLADEAAVRQTLEAGAHVVLFSGDKLLGGPQAGIAVGDSEAIGAMARHPLARAVRCDGPALAAVEATLSMYAEGRGAEIPFWQMAATPAAELRERCDAVIAASGVTARIDDGTSLPGAGSVPGVGIPGPVIAVPDRASAWRTLLDGTPPILGRRVNDDLVLDLRAVAADLDATVAAALSSACR